ncbi:(2Fe-2S) ferredoxin domain-containing protein [Streptomyces sp. LP11]|uniref:(2Fe-2S) ferredoxin domain-containing protein n=1 Tax=Streptomyces pyxinicus TaxID=2970331 RepID=A0ABT2B4B3_9ACTN|nr:(2Fe-2S) ferredoxin domain-containing protein [Streptomyces sp. LP11]MCS0603357.1 (2Fe-2S) ferredoxin domain-containing protein [Streptomyces sp. LP11]
MAAKGRAAGTGRAAVPCRVVVCRDCCCGTPKVPGIDHAQQTARLRSEVPVRVSGCLDVCEHANVVVVQPSTEGRAVGARPVWLGLVNDMDATEDIVAWVRAGGPGVAPLPEILGLYGMTPPRRSPNP